MLRYNEALTQPEQTFLIAATLILYIAAFYQNNILKTTLATRGKDEVLGLEILFTKSKLVKEEMDFASFKIFTSYWAFLLIFVAAMFLGYIKSPIIMIAITVIMIADFSFKWSLYEKIAKDAKTDNDLRRNIEKNSYKLITLGEKSKHILKKEESPKDAVKKMPVFENFLDVKSAAFFKLVEMPSHYIYFICKDGSVCRAESDNKELIVEEIDVAPSPLFQYIYEKHSLIKEELLSFAEVAALSVLLMLSMVTQ